MSKDNRLIQYKTFPLEFKEADESSDESEGRISGYASTFGNLDQGLDIVVKGAFKKTLKESKGKIPILADHSPYDQIGWNEKATEDATGLAVEGTLDLNVQKGRERYSLAKKALAIGAKAGLSIGYMTVTAEPDPANRSIRLLKELRLFEYSFVTFPMNVESMVTAAKSIGAIDSARFLLKNLMSQGVSIKDFEQALQLEAATVDEDPTLISQSIDNLIEKFRS